MERAICLCLHIVMYLRLSAQFWVDASSASSLFSNRQIKRSTREVIFLAHSIFLLTRHAKGLYVPPSMCNPPVPHWKVSPWTLAEIRLMHVISDCHYKHVVSLFQPHPLITSEKQFNKNTVSWLTATLTLVPHFLNLCFRAILDRSTLSKTKTRKHWHIDESKACCIFDFSCQSSDKKTLGSTSTWDLITFC